MTEEGREVMIHLDGPPAPQLTSPKTTPFRAPGEALSPIRDVDLAAHWENTVDPEATPRRGNASWESEAKDSDVLSTLDENLSIPLLSRSASGKYEGTNDKTHRLKMKRVVSGGSVASKSGTDESDLSDGEDDDDDYSTGTIAEKYDKVVLKVSRQGGVVELVYPSIVPPQPKMEEEVELDELFGHSILEEKSEASTTLSSCSSCSEDEFELPKGGEGDDDRFVLASTGVQTEEDKQRRERAIIRKAVLNAAAKAYKAHNLELPDLLLAQINENRGCGEKRRGKVALEDGQKRKKHRAPTTKGQTVVIDPSEGETANLLCQETAIEGKQKEEKVNFIVKKMKLSKTDEIHASPCQCALSLVGLMGFQSVSPSTSSSNISLDSLASLISPQPLLPSQGGGFWSSMKQTPATAPTKSTSNEDTDSRTVRFSAMRTASSRNLPARSSGRLVKTASAKAANYDDDGVQTKKENLVMNPTPQFSTDLKLGGPPGERPPLSIRKVSSSVSMFPKSLMNPSSSERNGRMDASAYTSLGYHEITLIRRSRTNATEEIEEGYTPWTALTIRCSDHDEMDVIIKALKDSAKATIVPFSPNPRAKLKKKAMEDVVKRRRALKRSRRRLTVSSDTKKTNKEDLSKKWSKQDQCEFCALNFTLLTRRHHCRKCDRSCCGDCSSVMLVRGGDETRYCNSCFTAMLRKQSRALGHRSAAHRRLPSSTLLGRVHPECRHLGVGVKGKLPHWKNYVTFNVEDRPAVGRITVELLQALALPTIDLTARADPYVRATITGYDRDKRWNLVEWTSSKQFSLCSGYCMSTLSPVWRGPGLRGGELLTLPVLSTAGAILRLEILHYDMMTNSKGKDRVLAVVEIPLSDVPNANLRGSGPVHKDMPRSTKKLRYDGYCDRWYRLQAPPDCNDSPAILAKPIEDPMQPSENCSKEDGKNTGLKSLEEIGKRLQDACVAPIEWIGNTLNIDMPQRRPDSACENHRSRSAIHVRIKLNASEVGDMLSHTWFPPVQPIPDTPPFDPQTLLTNIMIVGKQVEPYHKMWKFIEDCIKWSHPPEVCVKSYLVLAVHLYYLQYFLYYLHVYLVIFFCCQLKKMVAKKTANPDYVHADSSNSTSANLNLDEASSYDSEFDNDFYWDDGGKSDKTGDGAVLASPSLEDLNQAQSRQNSTSSQSACEPGNSLKGAQVQKPKIQEEDGARLGKAVHWLAKKLGDNRGLDLIQLHLGFFHRDIKNFNSLWDGSSIVKTCVSILVLCLTFILHLYWSHRFLWITGIAVWYFGISPYAKLFARAQLGGWRGLAKILRRRHLHEVEISKQSRRKS
eukprot:scaffold2658_cov53-Attheya_sp.AAC.1